MPRGTGPKGEADPRLLVPRAHGAWSYREKCQQNGPVRGQLCHERPSEPRPARLTWKLCSLVPEWKPRGLEAFGRVSRGRWGPRLGAPCCRMH